MKTSEQARIVEEFTANLRQTLLNNVGTMPENWNGCHIRAFAETEKEIARTAFVSFSEQQAKKTACTMAQKTPDTERKAR